MTSSLIGLFKTLDPGVIANLVVAGVLGTRSELEDVAISVTNRTAKSFHRSRIRIATIVSSLYLKKKILGRRVV